MLNNHEEWILLLKLFVFYGVLLGISSYVFDKSTDDKIKKIALDVNVATIQVIIFLPAMLSGIVFSVLKIIFGECPDNNADL